MVKCLSEVVADLRDTQASALRFGRHCKTKMDGNSLLIMV